MEEDRATRPQPVYSPPHSSMRTGSRTLIAYWKDRETLDGYLATTEVPRGTELMRKVGVEPEMRIVDVLDLG